MIPYKILEEELYSFIERVKSYLINNKNEIKKDLEAFLGTLFLSAISYSLNFPDADKFGHVSKGFLTASLFYHTYKLLFKDEKWKYLSILTTAACALLWEYLESFIKGFSDPYDILYDTLADSFGAIFYVIYKKYAGGGI
jgi:hypothetical protein